MSEYHLRNKIYIPRKYLHIWFACSSARSYVALENVVHSIERKNKFSAVLGGGCIAVIEGNGPRSAGRSCMESKAKRGL